MREHILLLLSLVLFVCGQWAAFYIFLQFRRYKWAFLKFLGLFLLFFNINAVIMMVNTYIHINLSRAFSLFYFFSLASSVLLMFLMLASYFNFVIRLFEEGIPAVYRYAMMAAEILIAAFALFGLESLLRNGSGLALTAAEFLFAGFMMAASMILVGDKKISSNPVDRRIAASFGSLYCILYLSCLLLFLLPLETARPLGWTLNILLALTPVLWFKYLFLKKHTLAVSLLNDKSGLKGICRMCHISPREEEIIQLILQGKRNREIERELGISLFTVKNHIQNIYNKLGVRSRMKLAQIIRSGSIPEEPLKNDKEYSLN